MTVWSVELLNTYSLIWLSVGIAGFIITCGIRLICREVNKRV